MKILNVELTDSSPLTRLSWRFIIPTLLFLLATLIVNNNAIIQETKANDKKTRLQEQLLRTKEKQAFQRAELAGLKSNAAIFKEIEEKRLDLESSKEPPIVIYDNLERE